MPKEVPQYTECSADDQNPFTEAVTPEEVWARLQRCGNTAPGRQRCGNTAPGPDGIRYAKWKEVDKGRHALNAVFNAVHRLDVLPQSWGKSVTILIHKKR